MHSLRRLFAVLLTGVVWASLAPAGAAPAMPTAPAFCHPGPIHAKELPARVRLQDCDLVGRTITAGPLSLQVPPPGVGRQVAGLTTAGEMELAVRTSLDRVVQIQSSETSSSPAVVAAAPPNETVATATPITLPYAQPGTTVETTQDPDDQAANNACGLGTYDVNHSVWFSLSVGATTDIVTDLASASPYPPVLQVFTESGGILTPVLCEGTDFSAQSGTTYLLRVGTYGSDGATFDLDVHAITAADRPGNDLFIDADPIGVPDTETVVEMQRASRQASEPPASCGDNTGTVWYRLQPGAQHRVRLGSDDALAVYRGTSLGALTQIACSRDNTTPTLVTLPLTGTFYVQMWDRSDPGSLSLETVSGEPTPGAPAPCAASAYMLEPDTKPRAKLQWRFNNGNAPSNLGGRKSLRAVKDGMQVITSSANDCGLDDRVNAVTEYLGATSRPASRCANDKSDKVNVVDFGPLPSGLLGLACSEFTGTSIDGPWTIVESDVRFLKSARWTVTPDAKSCNDRYDLVGTAAHETGHVFGLKHPGGAGAPNQTMSATAVSCNGGARTLGRGDVMGLRARY